LMNQNPVKSFSYKGFLNFKYYFFYQKYEFLIRCLILSERITKNFSFIINKNLDKNFSKFNFSSALLYDFVKFNKKLRKKYVNMKLLYKLNFIFNNNKLNFKKNLISFTFDFLWVYTNYK